MNNENTDAGKLGMIDCIKLIRAAFNIDLAPAKGIYHAVAGGKSRYVTVNELREMFYVHMRIKSGNGKIDADGTITFGDARFRVATSSNMTGIYFYIIS